MIHEKKNMEANGSRVQNIVLSGGSTMFDHFGQRLKRDLKNMVDRRIAHSEVSSGSAMRVCLLFGTVVPVTDYRLFSSRQAWTSMSSATNASGKSKVSPDRCTLLTPDCQIRRLVRRVPTRFPCMLLLRSPRIYIRAHISPAGLLFVLPHQSWLRRGRTKYMQEICHFRECQLD